MFTAVVPLAVARGCLRLECSLCLVAVLHSLGILAPRGCLCLVGSLCLVAVSPERTLNYASSRTPAPPELLHCETYSSRTRTIHGHQPREGTRARATMTNIFLSDRPLKDRLAPSKQELISKETQRHPSLHSWADTSTKHLLLRAQELPKRPKSCRRSPRAADGAQELQIAQASSKNCCKSPRAAEGARELLRAQELPKQPKSCRRSPRAADAQELVTLHTRVCAAGVRRPRNRRGAGIVKGTSPPAAPSHQLHQAKPP